jgi:hypothetical protein
LLFAAGQASHPSPLQSLAGSHIQEAVFAQQVVDLGQQALFFPPANTVATVSSIIATNPIIDFFMFDCCWFENCLAILYRALCT